MKKKTVALLLSLVLVFGVVAGGTFAWLTAKSAVVTNTFTYGDINIGLEESTGNDYTIIPGVDIAKDPKVTVAVNSEACWLFVKVVKTGTFVANKVTYEIADGWTLVPGQTDVYYRQVSATGTTPAVFNVLKGEGTGALANGVIKVSSELTKTDIKDIGNPTLTFTAYAVQQAGFATAEAAWVEAAKLG